MKSCFFAILLCFGLNSSPVPQGELQTISFTVHQIRSNQGMIRIAVYDRADKFNEEELTSFSFSKTAMRNGELECEFELAAGKYAFSLLDDENGDKDMNYNFIGIPTEGFGFSRDAKINLLSPPDFESCVLQVSSAKHEWRIKVRYF